MTIDLTDTTTGAIHEALTQARRRMGGPASGMVLTLIIVTDEAAQYDAVRAANQALKPIPAKLPANTINPDAIRATPHVNRRAPQTVCRLLAYNAELDLARALNTYLNDPDEYRAITRNLLHQPGHIHYTPTSITVTIDQPNAPRIQRALTLLIDQLNNNPPKLAGDNRKITYNTTTP